MLRLLAFTLPLCLDNFAIAFAVLGEIRLTRAQLLRVTVVFITFEAVMPLIGLAVGTPLIHLIAGPPISPSTLTSSAARPSSRNFSWPTAPTWPTRST